MVGRGGARQGSVGGVVLVVIPLLIAPIFLANVVFVFVEKIVNHGHSDQVLGAIIGMTPAALPLNSCRYLIKDGL